MSDYSFLQRALSIHPSDVVAALFGSYMAGATWNCCHLSISVYTILLCTILQHFMQSHIVECMGVSLKTATCTFDSMTGIFFSLFFLFLPATAVTSVWHEYQNKSQHRKLTMEKNNFPPLLRGLEPRPFDHESGTLTTELFPLSGKQAEHGLPETSHCCAKLV